MTDSYKKNTQDSQQLQDSVLGRLCGSICFIGDTPDTDTRTAETSITIITSIMTQPRGVDSLNDRRDGDLFKRVVMFRLLHLAKTEFNRRLWDMMLYRKLMITRQMMVGDIEGMSMEAIRSWTTFDTMISI